MSKIEIPLSKATVAETSDLAVNASKIITKHAIEDAYLTLLGTELGNTGSEMESSIATSRKKQLTEELAAADDKRDNGFNALKSFTEGYIKWGIEAYAPYAIKVWDVIKRHGLALDKESYEEQSALMESLFIDLEKAELTEAITILKQEEIVAYTKQSHIDFAALYQQSLEVEAGKEIVTSATKLKKGALLKLTNVANYLNAVVNAKPDVYGAIQAEMAELVNNVNKKIRNRTSK